MWKLTELFTAFRSSEEKHFSVNFDFINKKTFRIKFPAIHSVLHCLTFPRSLLKVLELVP